MAGHFLARPRYAGHVAGFEHEALIYEGLDGFAAGVMPFLREGLEAGEPMLVAVGAERIARLREALGEDADRVEFADMAELGRNPGRIIPAWEDFLHRRRADGAPVRGIGEPIWAGRRADELVECQLHEALLNVAFADAENFRLLCPYDRSSLDGAVVHEAYCSHPAVVDDGGRHASAAYRRDGALLAPFTAPLPPPRGMVDAVAFDRDGLQDVRRLVGARAAAAGLSPDRAADLVLAANEAAANSIRHAGGCGVLRVWPEEDTLICEVKDPGAVDDPLVGRHRPTVEQQGGWGVYIANQVCDLVQLRSGAQGTVVRVHMRVDSD
jgi:anti-sigma regulatory factor (Ser/Thr protein kinase)